MISSDLIQGFFFTISQDPGGGQEAYKCSTGSGKMCKSCPAPGAREVAPGPGGFWAASTERNEQCSKSLVVDD